MAMTERAPAAPVSIAALLRDRMGDLPPAERRVARALLAGYPTAGLETVARLAERAQTSAPTVVRLVGRLGFAGFGEFQDELRREIDEREAFPLTLVAAAQESAAAQAGVPGLLGASALVVGDAVRVTLQELPVHELERTVALLGDPGRRVTLVGGRFTRLLGTLLALHLMQLRGDVHLLPDPVVERAAALLDIGRSDVLVVLDFRRYEPRSEAIARRAKEAGATVILLTDRWLSPVSTIADVVLPARVDSVTPYDSLAPVLAIIEVVVGGIVAESGHDAEERLALFEQFSRDNDLL
jgi:DNA-binding MurR/RpiR family transcriptional regulator